MRKIIATIKILIFITFTIANYSFFAVGLMVAKLLGRNCEPWRNRCLKFWGKYSMKCLGVEIEIEGTPPEPPFFLVSNHLSYIDIPVYYYALNTTFVAKLEIKNWPVVGFMARTLGIIFIDRENKLDLRRVNSIISTKINRNQGVVLFPEGRTSPGDQILRFRAGLLQHPVEANFDVHYAVIRYETGESDPHARDSVCWWQDMSLLQHLLNLASNRSITARVAFGKKSIKHKDRKVLAKKLQREAEKIFVPVQTKA
ncbi:MAG: lysophospholipid acyltransferase family protein [Balneolaceae bacterium]|nr:lysophospholipid acyltransferase family protein [Balneolaceae bacterium]MDR9410950.1 lysophospholipid acyltransferase family protein [Balneolaceae bacterium]